LELAGFEVVDAARQYGNLALTVEGNWQLISGASRNVRQIEDAPEGLRRENPVAVYEYFVFPWALAVQVVSQKTKLRVVPQYVYHVGTQQISLEGKLGYTVRGARVRTLRIDLPGWEVDEIGPPERVDPDIPLSNEAGSVAIALAQAASGNFEITFKAHRAFPARSPTLELSLPRPVAEEIAPATIIVQAADNVELTPRAESMMGMVPQAGRIAAQVPQLQQSPLVYRAENASAKFVAGVAVQRQSISCDVVSKLDFDEGVPRLEQRQIYQVMYVPMDEFIDDVRNDMRSSGVNFSTISDKVGVVGPRNGFEFRYTMDVVTDRGRGITADARASVASRARSARCRGHAGHAVDQSLWFWGKRNRNLRFVLGEGRAADGEEGDASRKPLEHVSSVLSDRDREPRVVEVEVASPRLDEELPLDLGNHWIITI
jgi:hypothetical protein